MTHQEITYLIEQYALGTISTEKKAELTSFLSSLDQQDISDELISEWLEQGQSVDFTPRIETTIQEHLKNIFSTDKELDYSSNQTSHQVLNKPVVHRVHFLHKWWWAAASVLLLLVTSAYIWITLNKKDQPIVNSNNQLKENIAPGFNGAVLTLSDGRQVVLDSTTNGVIADQNGTQVILSNKQLIYNSRKANEVSYNTISTSRGRQYQLLLPDGSKVWLNAESSITYPTAFIGKEREVKITGELYMEIAQNSKQPFTVNTGKTTVQVLGTSFNINAYSDEEAQKTTLVEGSVKIVTSGQQKILRPGQEATITDDKIKIATASIDKTIAWKNGMFNFEDFSIEQAMRQLARWYNIEVSYESGIPDIEFGGTIRRDLPLNGLLDFLSESGLRFRWIGNRKLMILPN